jgi:hypothetical protein
MRLSTILVAFLAPLITVVRAQTQANPDFSGTGNIYLVQSADFIHANPNSTVGCLNSQGRFITNMNACGVFTKNSDSSVSSTAGQCSFDDTAHEGRPQAPPRYAFICTTASLQYITSFYSIVSAIHCLWSPGKGADMLRLGIRKQLSMALERRFGRLLRGHEHPSLWTIHICLDLERLRIPRKLCSAVAPLAQTQLRNRR